MTKVEQGIKDLLSKFDDQDLHSLVATVTQGLLKNKISTREEAVTAIINYSPDVISILKRKLVTRDLLFSYLHDQNIPISLPKTKSELIDKIVELWGIPSEPKELEKYPIKSIIHKTCYDLEETSSKNDETGEDVGPNVKLLAEQFSKWFYSLLNDTSKVPSEHFFSDAKLKINLYHGDECSTEIVKDDTSLIESLLHQTKINHNLYFNPNLTNEGVQGRMDQYGLVKIAACGTLHVNEACVGVFEQVFGIARDPFCDNNWKIKVTELNLRSKNYVGSCPKLTDSELTSPLLMLPSN